MKKHFIYLLFIIFYLLFIYYLFIIYLLIDLFHLLIIVRQPDLIAQHNHNKYVKK
jgi:phosphotransferase system  glucose/maltose/N-acetylglucosamine-specific IIC component